MSWLRQRLLRVAHRYYLELQLPALLDRPLQWIEKTFNERDTDTLAIDRPIFIVGCHRSGTTIFYETLAHHPEVVYFTNASSMYPNTPILNNQLMDWAGKNPPKIERFANDGLFVNYATPSEGIRIWERFMADRDNYALDETEDNPAMEHYLKHTIQKHLKHFGGQRFLNKNPDNSARIRYLNKLFPDAYFIHIVRDGRAVCASLLKFRKAAADFFGPHHRHATSGIKVKTWDEIAQYWDKDPIYSTGLLWRDVLETLAQDRPRILPKRYLEIRYEDFCQHPLAILKDVCQFCQLPWTPTVFEQAAQSIQLRDRNHTWQQTLTPTEIDQLTPLITPTLQTYGYSP